MLLSVLCRQLDIDGITSRIALGELTASPVLEQMRRVAEEVPSPAVWGIPETCRDASSHWTGNAYHIPPYIPHILHISHIPNNSNIPNIPHIPHTPYPPYPP